MRAPLAIFALALTAGCSYVTDFSVPVTGADGSVQRDGSISGQDGRPQNDASVPDGPIADGPNMMTDGEVPDAMVPDAQPDAFQGCRSNRDCNDQNECTFDVCGVDGRCRWSVVVCPDNDNIDCTRSFCNPTRGCERFADDGACRDTSPCTIDRCDVALGCTHTPMHSLCDDNNACTQDQCTGFTLGNFCQNTLISGCRSCVNQGDCGGMSCRPCLGGAQRCTERCVQGACINDCRDCEIGQFCPILLNP